MWCANTYTVAQRTQYYPSGLPWAYDRTLDHPDLQHRKYNGKEFVEMHGYDTYDFDHRGYFPAAGIFTTIDWKAEDTPDQSPYSYAENNPVRYRDENGDGIGDFLIGMASAYVDDANPFSNISSNAPRENEKHYQIGQTVGHFMAGLVGTSEIISGGGTALGGNIGGVVTSPSVAGAVAGYAVAASGVVEAGHGLMMLTKAGTGLKNQSAKTAPQGRSGTTIANENGVTVNSHGTNDAHKPVHAHVSGEGNPVRVGANGKPLKGQSELSTKQSKVVKNNLKAIRKEVNKVGKANKAIEDYNKKK